MPGRLIVGERKDADGVRVAQALAGTGLEVRRRLPELGVTLYTVAEAETESARQALAGSGLFRFVEHEYAARGGHTPDDPYYPIQWHLDRISAAEGWEISEGAAVVPIAVIDSGVDADHPDLADKILPGWDFICDAAVTPDHLGHGTSVAGVAAAATFNARGVAGVAPRNPVMPLVVLDSKDVALYSDIARAIVWAADHGARIVNLSLGGSAPSSVLQDAVDYAWARGVLVFAAAMNDGTTDPRYPAACERVQAIAATGSGDDLAPFSNHGSWIDFAAPGISIFTTQESGYGYVSGTSFASPIAAAVAALVLSRRPDLTPEEVIDVLRASSADLGPPGFDAAFGWGRIDAGAALREALGR